LLIQYIKVKGFLSYIEEIIEFEKFGNVWVIVGENGAGKSSIIDMITVALFGRARGVDDRGSGLEDLINKNCDYFEIELVFSMNDHTYRIIRRKFRNGPHELEFYIDDLSQTEKLSETQLKILNVIKINFDTCLDTFCVGQGQSARFMEKKPNERKEVFSQVLNLDKYEVLEKYTKELRKAIKDQIEKIDVKLNFLKDKITLKVKYQSDYNESKQEIVIVKKNIKTDEEELEKIIIEKNQYEQLKQQVDLILNQRNNLIKKIEIQETSIKTDIILQKNLEVQIVDKLTLEIQLKDIQKEIDTDQLKLTKISSEKSSLETTNNILTTQGREYKTKFLNLQNYNQGSCSFCGNEITENYKQQYLNELKAEALKFASEINNNKLIIQQLDEQLTKINNQLSQNRIKSKDTQIKYNKTLQSETQLNGLKIRLIDSQKNLEDLKEEYKQNSQVEIEKV